MARVKHSFSRQMAAYMQKDIIAMNRKLDMINREMLEELHKWLTYAALPIVQAAQNKAPRGTEVHYRYKDGKKIETYHPGNLKHSVQVLKKLKTRRKKSQAVFIGPIFNSRGSVFGLSRYNAYYAHMIEYGTVNQPAQPFMRPGLDIGGPIAKKRLELIARFHLKRWEQRYGKQ